MIDLNFQSRLSFWKEKPANSAGHGEVLMKPKAVGFKGGKSTQARAFRRAESRGKKK